ncbi:MAG: DUF2974 domain-containing protein [Spirochaetaceae bacterium]|jgi:hypothetical protein|nr:DUF2974 domain-containing protein [Spirochaetaceae bacterium]
MSNVFDYLEWRGDLSFDSVPFNPVDNIIFSIISYFPWDDIVPGINEKETISFHHAVRKLMQMESKNPQIQRLYIFKSEQEKILPVLTQAERYKNVFLSSYVNTIDMEKQMQFSALTLKSDGCLPYLAFRGTDTTVIGWREDFNMIFDGAVPAQIRSVEYLEKVAHKLKGKFNVGGHSKGGNLAVYSAAFCVPKIKKRIAVIYNNDAPGFSKKTTLKPQYIEIQNKIQTFIPQDSVIGLLFEHEKKYTVVKSCETGLMQHNPFSWQVSKNNMVKQDSITLTSKFFNNTLMEWLDGMDHDMRHVFIDTIFEIINNTKMYSVTEFKDNWFKNAGLMIKSMNNLDKETKKKLLKIFAALFKTAKNNFTLFLKEKNSQKENKK